MGDGADMAIDAMFEEQEYRELNPDEFEDENSDYSPVPKRYAPKLKVCRQCGKGGFHWQKSKESGSWRLFDKDNKVHNCSEKFPKQNKNEKRVDRQQKSGKFYPEQFE